jgi:hypothetical protein
MVNAFYGIFYGRASSWSCVMKRWRTRLVSDHTVMNSASSPEPGQLIRALVWVWAILDSRSTGKSPPLAHLEILGSVPPRVPRDRSVLQYSPSQGAVCGRGLAFPRTSRTRPRRFGVRGRAGACGFEHPEHNLLDDEWIIRVILRGHFSRVSHQLARLLGTK